MSFVEHSGKGVDALRQALQDLEAQMESLGLQPLIRKRSGGETATGKAIDEAKTDSDIQMWIRAMELGLEAGFEMAGHWVKTQLPEDFSIDIFSDFGLGMRAEFVADHLLKASQATRLSKETYLREIKGMSYLSDTVDIEEEMARIEAEGPPLAQMGMGEGDDQDGDVEGANLN
jgi:hypothetical protein